MVGREKEQPFSIVGMEFRGIGEDGCLYWILICSYYFTWRHEPEEISVRYRREYFVEQAKRVYIEMGLVVGL